MSEWISVKDRLPNEKSHVLIVWNGEVSPFIYLHDPVHKYWWRLGVSAVILNSDKITHWMPLPEPPKE